MNLKLYHYVHCPFCVRVRMTLGYFKLPYESVVVAYDDEETPKKLTGLKMLPILDIDGKAMNESIDIMAFLDKDNKLGTNKLKNPEELNLINLWLNRLGTNIHNMAMPYWIYTAEFNDQARAYFQTKKELKRGPFKDLVHKRNLFETALLNDLRELEVFLKPYFQSETFGAKDILIASHLWGMYIVPEFRFSDKIHDYLQAIKKVCQFDYHQDFWK